MTNPSVKLARAGQYVELTPPIDWVASATAGRVLITEKMNGGLGLARRKVKALKRSTNDSGDPSLVCIAGMYPAIGKVLSGCQYRVVDGFTERPALAGPQIDKVKERGSVDASFLELVQSHDRALVRYGVEIDIAWLVAQVAIAWPALTISIVTATINEARDLRRRLLNYLPWVTVVTGQDGAGTEYLVERIVVSTFTHLAHPSIEIDKRDVVIVANALEVGGNQARDSLPYARRARMYGFVGLEQELAPFDEDVLRVWFGFDEIELHGHGQPAIQVETLTWTRAGGKQLPIDLSLVDVKRRGVWHEHIRNRRLTKLAALLQDRQLAELMNLFPEIPGLAASRPNASMILFLVENLEHALVVAELLPAWSIIDGSAQAALSERTGMIVTYSGLARISVANIDIAIRADGGTGLPEFRYGGEKIIYTINNSPGAFSQGKETPAQKIIYSENNSPESYSGIQRVLLIDCLDRHHPRLRKMSRKRSAAYQNRGWFRAGTDPVQARVDFFLETRSGVDLE